MKSLLSGQLKEIQDSRAYFSLGLSKNASEEDIKRAYRAMAVRLHPDKPGGDTQRFQQLQDAYQQIKNKRSKQSQSQTQSRSKKSSSPSSKQSKRPKPESGRGQGDDQEGSHSNTKKEEEEDITNSPDEGMPEPGEMGESVDGASPQKKKATEDEKGGRSLISSCFPCHVRSTHISEDVS
jgi:DnaJ-class molecular chaperone